MRASSKQKSWKRVFPSYRDRTRFASAVRRWGSRLGLDERSLRERFPNAVIFRQLDNARANLKREMAELFGHLKGMKSLSRERNTNEVGTNTDFVCKPLEQSPPSEEIKVPDINREDLLDELYRTVQLAAQGRVTRSEGADSEILPIDADDDQVIEDYLASHPVDPEPPLTMTVRGRFPALPGAGSNRKIRKDQLRDYRTNLTSLGLAVQVSQYGDAALKEDYRRLSVALGLYGPRSGYHGPTKPEYDYVSGIVDALRQAKPAPKPPVRERPSDALFGIPVQPEHRDLADFIRNLPD